MKENSLALGEVEVDGKWETENHCPLPALKIEIIPRYKNTRIRSGMSENAQEQASEDKPNFENAMERLETVVESMESGEAPLSDLVTRYEEGARLLKLCRKELEEAELKIKAVRKQDGQTVTETIPIETE